MAEKRSSAQSRKAHKKSSGKTQIIDGNCEDVAKRRAALENAIRRKIESEKRALHIVECLLEDDVAENFLADCARFISPAHYKDIVEERSIIKSCGYPICRKKLENVPKQKYRISTKTNKVYDITERKCFCSNFCFRASKFYETQIPQSPVWMREEECPPDIKLLKDGNSGQSGVEVKLVEKHVKPSDIERSTPLGENDGDCSAESDNDGVKEEQSAFVSSIISVDEFSSGLTETPQLNSGPSGTEDTRLTETTERFKRCKLSDQGKFLELDEQDNTQGLSQEMEPTEDPGVPKSGQSVENLCVTQRAVSKRGAEQLRKLLGNFRQCPPVIPDLVSPITMKGSMLEVLNRTLNEWKTEETLKYLFGSNYVVESTFLKKNPSHEEDCAEELDEDDLETNDLDITFESPKANKPLSINECLSLQGNSDSQWPTPDLRKLKEETEMLEIKVRKFFGGRYILPEEIEEESQSKEATTKNTKETSWVPMLPLVDSCSQQQIRQRIVVEKLKKVLPAILLPLKITYSDVSRELHNLVKTFRFTNTNITHTSPEWSIIAVVLLSALLPTMPLHKDCQQNPLYSQFISKLLEELHFKSDDLELLKQTFACRSRVPTAQKYQERFVLGGTENPQAPEL
ncbi:putative RNA polymerase II subunit B1 CTD phosphatase RPAP2 [Pelodytes ibericus]